MISIDGSTGAVYLGELPVVASPVTTYLEGLLDSQSDEASPVVKAVHRLLTHADSIRRLQVRANADTPEDAIKARILGGEGVGLCRTEHMFLGPRRSYVERLVLAENEDVQRGVIGEMEIFDASLSPKVRIPLLQIHWIFVSVEILQYLRDI